MTIREFYDKTGGDYEGVMERLLAEDRIKKFVRMFKADPSYTELEECLTQNDAKGAFRSAHTLKGVCMSIGFDRLLEQVNIVTEALRKENIVLALEYMPGLRSCYSEIIEEIDGIQ